MFEKVLKIIKNNDENELRNYMQDHYDELGKMVFDLCVDAENADDEEIEKYTLIIKSLIKIGHLLDYTDENGSHALFPALKSQKLPLIEAFDGLNDLFFQENDSQLAPITYSYFLDNEDIQIYCTKKLGKHVNDRICIQGDFTTYFALAMVNCSIKIGKLIAENKYFEFHPNEIYLDEIEWEDTEEDLEKQKFIESIKH